MTIDERVQMKADVERVVDLLLSRWGAEADDRKELLNEVEGIACLRKGDARKARRRAQAQNGASK